MPRLTIVGFAIGLVVSTGLPAAGQPETCALDDWQACPDVMLVDPANPGDASVGGLRFISNLVVHLSDYQTAQYLQTEVPAGASTEEWQVHNYDNILTPVTGKSRLWWLNRDTRKRESVVVDPTRHSYLLIPAGVPHFLDRRTAKTDALVVEFLLSREPEAPADQGGNVDEPLPPAQPLE